VRSKQRATADLIVQMFDDRPGERNAIVGACATPNFVEDHEAARCGGIQNPRGFGHLDHEGALTARQLIACANAGENPVANSNRSARRW